MSSLDRANKDLSLLHPVVRTAVQQLQQKLAEAKLPFIVFEAFRSPQRQAHLFAKRPRVTKSRPWSSYHQYGMAADFVLDIEDVNPWQRGGRFDKMWEGLHQLGRQVGLEPLSWETPHLQHATTGLDALRAGRYPPGGDESWAANLELAIRGWQGPEAAPPLPNVGIDRPPLPAEFQDEPPPGEPLEAEPRGASDGLDAGLLADLFPKADREIAAALAADDAALRRTGLFETPRRLSYFLAQIAHESGGLTIREENLNYRAERAAEVFPRYFPTVESARPFAHNPEVFANRVYSNRLGNGPPDSGDGWRYRGRGLIQITGKDIYREIGRELGIDLVTSPDLAALPRYTVHVACAFWRLRRLNRFCDAGDFRALTKAINGGFNGLADREQWLARINARLMEEPMVAARADAPPTDSAGGGGAVRAFADAGPEMGMGGLAFGARGPEVEALQRSLAEARYAVGAIDGIFGDRTRAAVLALQADHGLPTTGRAGPETWAVLRSGAQRPVSEERREATADTLRQLGSRTVVDAARIRWAGLASAILGALGLFNGAVTTAAPQVPVPGTTGSAAASLPDALVQACHGVAQIGDAAARTILQTLCRGTATAPGATPTTVPTRTVLDYLPGLFADPGVQSIVGGFTSAIGSFVPATGTSLLALGLGLGARLLGQRIIDARVDDHRSGRNLGK